MILTLALRVQQLLPEDGQVDHEALRLLRLGALLGVAVRLLGQVKPKRQKKSLEQHYSFYYIQ